MKRYLLASTLVLFACDSGGGSGGAVDAGPVDLGPRSTLTADQATAARQACQFTAGTLPGLSLAQDAPLGPQIPIDTIVVIMMENRSFDHVLSDLPSMGITDVDVAPMDATNPDRNGQPVARYHETALCFDDTNHEWQGSHQEYDDGKNDGFVLANEDGLGDPDGHRAMGYYTATDLPYLYGLASNFAIGDRYFDSLLGPTFPNREYLYAATSFGNTTNLIITKKVNNIFDELDAANVPWAEYHESLPGSGELAEQFTRHLNEDKLYLYKQFAVDAAAGMLPNVAFVDPNLVDTGANHDDFHPPGDIQLGDAWLKKTIDTAIASPQWPHMAIFVTWDENGGLYDHVPPPPACVPDNLPPDDSAGGFQYDRYGFRVPILVISPYAKPKFVSHVVHDHTSITRFIEARYILPAMTNRDANADPMYEMFDFSNPALLHPPTLPMANPVDPDKLKACEAMFPDSLAKDGGVDMAGSGSDGGVPMDAATPLDAATHD